MMNKNELMQKAKEYGLVHDKLTWDYAIPMSFGNTCRDKLKGLIEQTVLSNVSGHFVWAYDEENELYGRPQPITEAGQRILMTLNDNFGTKYDINPGEPDLMSRIVAYELAEKRKTIIRAICDMKSYIDTYEKMIDGNNRKMHDHMMSVRTDLSHALHLCQI